MTDPQTAAARGAALLDVHVPDWWQTIDAGRLDIADGCQCALGQAFGGYVSGIIALYKALYPQRDGWVVPLDYGFIALSDDYAPLNAAWREEIAARRLAHMPQPAHEPAPELAAA